MDDVQVFFDRIADDLAPVFERNGWRYIATGPVRRRHIRDRLDQLYQSALVYGRTDSGRLYVDVGDGYVEAGLMYTHFEGYDD